MTLAPLASFDELVTYMPGVTLDEAQSTMLLNIASATIRSEAGQTFTLVEADELRLLGSWSRRFRLPQRPVLSIDSVFLGHPTMDLPVNAVDGLIWSSDGWVGFADNARGIVVNAPSHYGGNFGGDGVYLDIVYDHGYADEDMPWDIKGMCLDVARRAISVPNAGFITQTSLGSFSESYARQVASTLTADERRKLRPYKMGQTTVVVGR